MSNHRPTCGRQCPGEPQCSETEAVVLGASDDELRARFGSLPIDAACTRHGCGAKAGEPCRDERDGVMYGRWYHGERSVAARRMRQEKLT
jgi:hypothetical protein